MIEMPSVRITSDVACQKNHITMMERAKIDQDVLELEIFLKVVAGFGEENLPPLPPAAFQYEGKGCVQFEEVSHNVRAIKIWHLFIVSICNYFCLGILSPIMRRGFTDQQIRGIARSFRGHILSQLHKVSRTEYILFS